MWFDTLTHGTSSKPSFLIKPAVTLIRTLCLSSLTLNSWVRGMNKLANDEPKVTQSLQELPVRETRYSDSSRFPETFLPKWEDLQRGNLFDDLNDLIRNEDRNYVDLNDYHRIDSKGTSSNKERTGNQESNENRVSQPHQPSSKALHTREQASFSSSLEDPTELFPKHGSEKSIYPLNLRKLDDERILKSFSKQPSRVGIYDSYDSTFFPRQKGSSAAGQTSIHQRGGTPNPSSEHLKSSISTRRESKENSNAVRMVNLNGADMASKAYPFSRPAFRRSTNVPKGNVLLPLAISPYSHASASPSIFLPSHVASEELTSDFTTFNELLHGNTGQEYPPTPSFTKSGFNRPSTTTSHHQTSSDIEQPQIPTQTESYSNDLRSHKHPPLEDMKDLFSFVKRLKSVYHTSAQGSSTSSIARIGPLEKYEDLLDHSWQPHRQVTINGVPESRNLAMPGKAEELMTRYLSVGPENEIVGPLKSNNPTINSRASESREPGSSFPHTLDEPFKVTLLENSGKLFDDSVQSNNALKRKQVSTGNHPIWKSSSTGKQPIEPLHPPIVITETLPYTLRSAFPILSSRNPKWFKARSAIIEARLVELTPAIQRLHVFCATVDLAIRRRAVPKWTRRSLGTVRGRLEKSMIEFFDMLSQTRSYIGVESLEKANEGGLIDLEIDSLYTWWEDCWKRVEFWTMREELDYTSFTINLVDDGDPGAVLDSWYRNGNIVRLSSLCAAWLVTKWMQTGAPNWIPKLDARSKLVLEGTEYDKFKGNSRAEILIQGLRHEGRLGPEPEYYKPKKKTRGPQSTQRLEFPLEHNFMD